MNHRQALPLILSERDSTSRANQTRRAPGPGYIRKMETMNKKPKRQRQQYLDEFWNLYVQACGGRCCACGGEGKLERGHIGRHADGGPDDIENLIPICRPCNGKYNKTGTTPSDGRPPDWKDRFLKLQMQHLGVGPKVHAPWARSAYLNGAATIENTPVVPLGEVDFVADSSYVQPYATPPPPSPDQIRAAYDELLWRGKNESVKIPPPTKKTLDEMYRLASVYGIEKFLAVGREFLASGDWYDTNGEIVSRLMKGHEWEHFCANFSLYRRLLRERLAAEARSAEAQRKQEERERQQAEAQRQRERDPEYQRQQAEKRDAALKENAQRRRNFKVRELQDKWLAVAGEIDISDNQSALDAYYQIRNHLLDTLRTCPDADFEKHKKEFARQLKIMTGPNTKGGDLSGGFI